MRKKVGGRHTADLLLQLPARGRPSGSAALHWGERAITWL